MSKLVYVAGPYRSVAGKEGVKSNIKEAERAAIGVLLRGDVPVIPHKITSFFDDEDRWPAISHWTIKDWILKFNFPLLESCDCIELVKGWEHSKGAKLELAYAELIGKEVIYPK